MKNCILTCVFYSFRFAKTVLESIVEAVAVPIPISEKV